jgi:predicted MPP superfamily phosphohydrolase
MNEDLGLYMRNGRMLNVSAGVGGLVPFRYGVTPEIVVITLHKIK